MAARLPDCISFLFEPKSYPHAVYEIQLIQTHISYVFLAGDYVYKIKKPVNFGFLDFSTLTQRHFYCLQEVELNRRLCPSVYIGVVSISRQGGGFTLDGPGEAIEYGVKMKRLPEEGMMGAIMKRGELTEVMIDRIVGTLVPFYENADRKAVIDTFGTAAAVGANVLENLHHVEPFVGGESLGSRDYEVICAYVESFLGKEALFGARIAERRIRDCHGDLHSGNICIADKVYIFDCIEFNKRFRYGDIANDVAFLAMDLEYNERYDFAERFISKFEEMTGDVTLREVLQFYKCYRAMVRGKVGVLMAHEQEVKPHDRREALARAHRYFSLARRYAEK